MSTNSSHPKFGKCRRGHEYAITGGLHADGHIRCGACNRFTSRLRRERLRQARQERAA